MADPAAFDQLVLQLMSNQNASRQSAEQMFGKLKVHCWDTPRDDRIRDSPPVAAISTLGDKASCSADLVAPIHLRRTPTLRQPSRI